MDVDISERKTHEHDSEYALVQAKCEAFFPVPRLDNIIFLDFPRENRRENLCDARKKCRF